MVNFLLTLVLKMRIYPHIHGPGGCTLPSFLRLLLSNKHRNNGYTLAYIHVTFESTVDVVHEPFKTPPMIFKTLTLFSFPVHLARKLIMISSTETAQNFNIRNF